MMIHMLISVAVLLAFLLLAIFSITGLMLFSLFVGVPHYAFSKSLYWKHVWMGFDELFNAFLDGGHWETISSRLGKSIFHNHPPVFFSKKIDKSISWMLSQVDPDHCLKSIDWKVGRGQITNLVESTVV